MFKLLRRLTDEMNEKTAALRAETEGKRIRAEELFAQSVQSAKELEEMRKESDRLLEEAEIIRQEVLGNLKFAPEHVREPLLEILRHFNLPLEVPLIPPKPLPPKPH